MVKDDLFADSHNEEEIDTNPLEDKSDINQETHSRNTSDKSTLIKSLCEVCGCSVNLNNLQAIQLRFKVKPLQNPEEIVTSKDCMITMVKNSVDIDGSYDATRQGISSDESLDDHDNHGMFVNTKEHDTHDISKQDENCVHFDDMMSDVSSNKLKYFDAIGIDKHMDNSVSSVDSSNENVSTLTHSDEYVLDTSLGDYTNQLQDSSIQTYCEENGKDLSGDSTMILSFTNISADISSLETSLLEGKESSGLTIEQKEIQVISEIDTVSYSCESNRTVGVHSALVGSEANTDTKHALLSSPGVDISLPHTTQYIYNLDESQQGSPTAVDLSPTSSAEACCNDEGNMTTVKEFFEISNISLSETANNNIELGITEYNYDNPSGIKLNLLEETCISPSNQKTRPRSGFAEFIPETPETEQLSCIKSTTHNTSLSDSSFEYDTSKFIDNTALTLTDITVDATNFSALGHEVEEESITKTRKNVNPNNTHIMISRAKRYVNRLGEKYRTTMEQTMKLVIEDEEQSARTDVESIDPACIELSDSVIEEYADTSQVSNEYGETKLADSAYCTQLFDETKISGRNNSNATPEKEKEQSGNIQNVSDSTDHSVYCSETFETPVKIKTGLPQHCMSPFLRKIPSDRVTKRRGKLKGRRKHEEDDSFDSLPDKCSKLE